MTWLTLSAEVPCKFQTYVPVISCELSIISWCIKEIPSRSFIPRVWYSSKSHLYMYKIYCGHFFHFLYANKDETVVSCVTPNPSDLNPLSAVCDRVPGPGPSVRGEWCRIHTQSQTSEAAHNDTCCNVHLHTPAMRMCQITLLFLMDENLDFIYRPRRAPD